MRKNAFGVAVLSVLVLLSSCGTSSSLKGEAPVMNAGRPEVIDYQGQALGSEIPAWVVAIGDGQTRKVIKSLGLDGNTTVFMLQNKGNDLDFLKTWTDQVDARAEVASSIEQTVGQTVQTELEAKQADEQTKSRAAKIYSSTITNIILNGLAKEASYWVKTRTLKAGLKKASSDSDYVVEYTYYVVYGIDSALYEQQIKKAMGDVQDNDDQTVFLKDLLTKKLTEKIQLPVDAESFSYGDAPVEEVSDSE